MKIAEYSISSLFSPTNLSEHRCCAGPSARELLFHIRSTGSWSYLAVTVVAAFAAALALGYVRPAIFVAGWRSLSCAGLVAIYWISTNPLTSHVYNSSDRTIDAMMIGSALLVPVLFGRPREKNGDDAGAERLGRRVEHDRRAAGL